MSDATWSDRLHPSRRGYNLLWLVVSLSGNVGKRWHSSYMGQFGKCYFINQESWNCDFTPMKLQVVPTSIYCKDWFVKKKKNHTTVSKLFVQARAQTSKSSTLLTKKCNKPTHSKVFVKAFQLCFNTNLHVHWLMTDALLASEHMVWYYS